MVGQHKSEQWVNILWNLQHLTEFANFKARYDDNFIKERLDEVEKTSSLKDDQARGELSETLRIKLSQAATEALENWQKLKRYIADAYATEFQKPKTEAAGIGYYDKASNSNWDSCQGLLKSGSIFIDENMADLTANKNMPDNFKDVFNAAKDKFNDLHQNFLDSEESTTIQTDSKISANNDIHSKLMAMFLDGQEIFKNNEAEQKQFIFEQTLYLTSGTGTSGVKGYITNAKDKSLINGASIKLSPSTKSTVTDESGRYEITQVGAGKYQIEISAMGFQTHTIAEHEIKVGTMSTLNVEMTQA